LSINKTVRSFGTEGRRGKLEEEIHPSDNVFDYVVFRGSDIKDLQVFEAPPKPATPQPSLPQDPAIMVSIHHLFRYKYKHVS
jgi:protein LSM14